MSVVEIDIEVVRLREMRWSLFACKLDYLADTGFLSIPNPVIFSDFSNSNSSHTYRSFAHSIKRCLKMEDNHLQIGWRPQDLSKLFSLQLTSANPRQDDLSSSIHHHTSVGVGVVNITLIQVSLLTTSNLFSSPQSPTN